MADKAKDRLTSNIVISSVVLLVLLAALVFLALDTKSVSEDVLVAKSELNTKIDELSKLAQLREEAAIAEPKFEILENILPGRDDLFSFTSEIEGLGTHSGVNASFTFGPEGSGSISYVISAIGSYDNIIDYMKVIEEDIPFMSISNVDVISTADNEYRATISGSVFFDEEG